MITKAQARTVIRSLLDDEGRQRWGDAALDVLTQLVIDELWGEVLDVYPWYASQKDEVIADANGLVDLSSAGSLTKRYGRIQSVTKDSVVYFPTHPLNVVMQDDAQVYAPDRSYIVMGKKMYGFPLDSGCTYEVRYNYFPESFTELDESDEVDWPDGFENAFIFETAARAMVKGEKETVAQYQALGMQAFDRMRGVIKRAYVGPATINHQDDPMDMGGI